MAVEAKAERPLSDKKPKKKPTTKSAAKMDVATKPVHVSGSSAPTRRRHFGLFFAFILMVVAPVSASFVYLTNFAQPQYASRSGFVVRALQQGSANELLGGLGALVGNAGGEDSDILFEFLQSPDIVQKVNMKVDLVEHYSRDWSTDPVFSISPSATKQDLAEYWQRIVRLTYNQASGMLMVEVRAKSSDMALQISELIIVESEAMINELNVQARRDSMESARIELEESFLQYQSARQAMIAFQARTQIIDPKADIQARMGVLRNLQQELAEALVEYDLYKNQVANESDPRIKQLQLRINAVRERIASERINFTAGNVTADNTDYPTLLSDFEGLQVDLVFAEESYRAAMTTLSAARSRADRQQLYLATFIGPTTTEAPEYPQVPLLVFLTFVFSTMAWAVTGLIYYSLRDRG